MNETVKKDPVTPVSLRSLMTPSKTVDFEYPGCKGFNVSLCYLAREELMKLRNRCVKQQFNRKTRSYEEKMDDDKFLEEYTKAVIKEFKLAKPYFLLIQHPVTTEIKKSEYQIQATLEAMNKSGINTLIILPNNDAGYTKIMDQIKDSKILRVKTLSIDNYVNLLRYSTGLIGNSSSGIHEAAYFDIPVISIGTRQRGRLRPDSVIDVD